MHWRGGSLVLCRVRLCISFAILVGVGFIYRSLSPLTCNTSIVYMFIIMDTRRLRCVRSMCNVFLTDAFLPLFLL